MTGAPSRGTSLRRPGRPRSAAADQAILSATIDVLAEEGFEGMSVEGVAARARVGKATIYRRYPSKVELVMAAVARVAAEHAPWQDTGTTRGDLQALARGFVVALDGTEFGRLVHAMLGATSRSPDLASSYHGFVARRRAITYEVIERGISRGDLRADTPLDLVADLIVSPIFFRVLVTGGAIDAAFADQLVDAIMRAFGVAGSSQPA